ncbi:Re/Si-specific NAD(P)(+) transhydrogenase subunit alpha [Brachybacterium sp. EF45031]|uniref:Re/Si-specific NAD(P)(+) transhydrogenase subunit alpha n=1 Tax=Brachybacterium sillae TaxID=2810536 RepID=UPI00217CC358|nr:Re/Si-specific NAD(P)(+) transhydrogenase subunit alpha [Brachybacterium sillae]MCS6712083.1 Re/Si-specific NAD(P)(+) transhydrogenase subunit alpha [Brachybacterium sillae]
MQIAIGREAAPEERRAAATPATVTALLTLGYDVLVESGAGERAAFPDSAYRDAGARITDDEREVWGSDIVLGVNEPTREQVSWMRQGAVLATFLHPAQYPQLVEALRAQGVTALAMDMVPRISRAQSLDALSSMANISGYRAVVEAASRFGRFFAGQVTAAGKVPPATVFVIGTGVAGLAAIGAANGLGAQVKATDVRPETAEQVRSMGAEFVAIRGAEQQVSSDGYAKEASADQAARAAELYAEQTALADIVITTASIPGRPSPRLLTAEMVAAMKPGSVIVDLAALGGGNCELTRPGETVTTDNGVTIIGWTDMPSRLPGQSSQLYGTNLVNLLKLLTPGKDGQLVLDLEDVVQRTMCVAHAGEVLFPPPPVQVAATPAPAGGAAGAAGSGSTAAPAAEAAPAKAPRPWQLTYAAVVACGLAFILLSLVTPAAFLGHFWVFALAVIVGYYVVWRVSHALHTPLMSVTNAVSGIIIVGAILQITSDNLLVKALAFLAMLIATINIVGGFAVTQRMLTMFRRG